VEGVAEAAVAEAGVVVADALVAASASEEAGAATPAGLEAGVQAAALLASSQASVFLGPNRVHRRTRSIPKRRLGLDGPCPLSASALRETGRPRRPLPSASPDGDGGAVSADFCGA
jgi:hypothetical protein